jgi:hypothetical protein
MPAPGQNGRWRIPFAVGASGLNLAGGGEEPDLAPCSGGSEPTLMLRRREAYSALGHRPTLLDEASARDHGGCGSEGQVTEPEVDVAHEDGTEGTRAA